MEDFDEYEARREEDTKAFQEAADLCAEDENEVRSGEERKMRAGRKERKTRAGRKERSDDISVRVAKRRAEKAQCSQLFIASLIATFARILSYSSSFAARRATVSIAFSYSSLRLLLSLSRRRTGWG